MLLKKLSEKRESFKQNTYFLYNLEKQVYKGIKRKGYFSHLPWFFPVIINLYCTGHKC